MLGRCLVQPVMRARCLASPAAVTTSRRALTNSSRSYWLSEKGLYPLMAITAGAVALGAWYSTYYEFSPPKTKMRRHESLKRAFTGEKAYDGSPTSESLDKKSTARE